MQALRHVRAEAVVAGGGPVGLLLAAELAGYGVDTVVLEAGHAVSERPRAGTLHARAVQSLVRRGYLPRSAASPEGGGSRAPFHFAGLPGLLINVPDTEPGPLLKWPQARLERLFEERAVAAGARVLRGHRADGLTQDADGVRVTAQGPDGPLVCEARYLVGADGARGSVRELAGIRSEVRAATVAALAGTVTLPDPQALADGWHHTPRGWIVAKRDPRGRVHLRTLDCSGPHTDRHSDPTLEELRREVSRIAGREVAMEEPRWLSRFSDFTRLARTFRSGRVLLAGDAAHVHFPIGGQGLSTGVLDALNLGWKLAAAVRGTAGPDLLDTYDAERRPAARRVVENTRAQLALMRPGPDLDALRGVFATLMAADREDGRLGDMVSGQDTVLPPGPGGASGAAGRFLRNTALDTDEGGTDVIELLRDGRPLLLVGGPRGSAHREAVRGREDLLRVVEFRPAPELPYDGLLVRPDGYIAWAAGPGDPEPPAGGPAGVLSAYFAAGARAGRA
ncbi:FAD-dependent monooxygenase [Streptomyces sp. NPDC012888]|uniref:FAD-dependent monooxygenase n=1 Tax=Streptomyces sp. NPDC012888 TaxID=3364855 RepID=UPI0036D01028